MKKTLIILSSIVICVSVFSFCGVSEYAQGVIDDLDERKKYVEITSLNFGDVVFQSSTSGQSKAIQLATKSKYSHVGIVFGYENGDWQILEAVQPVKVTPLSTWKKQGDTEGYSVKRLKNSETFLSEEVKEKMTILGNSWLGKDYDIYFDWSDEELYCSELVWKLYQEILDVELGNLRPLKDFNLDHPIVKKIMKQRYGENIPWDSMMISPGDMYESENLEEVSLSVY